MCGIHVTSHRIQLSSGVSYQNDAYKWPGQISFQFSPNLFICQNIYKKFPLFCILQLLNLHMNFFTSIQSRKQTKIKFLQLNWTEKQSFFNEISEGKLWDCSRIGDNKNYFMCNQILSLLLVRAFLIAQNAIEKFAFKCFVFCGEFVRILIFNGSEKRLFTVRIDKIKKRQFWVFLLFW